MMLTLFLPYLSIYIYTHGYIYIYTYIHTYIRWSNTLPYSDVKQYNG